MLPYLSRCPQLGESGRARTDDPLLIGLDMTTCLTGVSLGRLVP